MKPAWFYKLSPREQRKQLNRWRYVRRYYRRKYGDRWAMWTIWLIGRFPDTSSEPTTDR